jgi:HAD superfamily hydrolase (TIGR01490 family)
MAITVYDLDHTLIDADCSQLWIKHLINSGIAGPEFIEAAERQHQQYLAGTLDMNDYLELVLRAHIGQTVAEATTTIGHFINTYIAPHIRPEALANIRQHQQAGDRCVVISASVDFLVEPIARHLGITDAVGVRIELDKNRITGKGIGVTCFQEGKIFYFREWLEQNNENATGCWFYSDSHNDIPLLEVVDNAVAVSADPQLVQVATEKGWQIVNW